MKCDDIQNKLIFYLEGTMDQMDMEMIKDHMKLCDNCRSTQSLIEQSYQYIDKEKSMLAPEFLSQRIVESWQMQHESKYHYLPLSKLQKVAAILLVTVGLAAGLVLGNNLYNTDHSTTPSVSEEFNLHNNIGSFETFLLTQ